MKFTEKQFEALEWAIKRAETARDSVTSTRDKIFFDTYRQELTAIKDNEANSIK